MAVAMEQIDPAVEQEPGPDLEVTTDEDRPLDVSVILPVYNEKGHLGAEIDRIRAALDHSHYSYEIIVVDDGSNDGSGEALAEIEGIRLLRFATNRGSGSARKYGTKAARGRVVVWTDVDMTYPNERIPELVKELDGFDQVVGARTSRQARVRPDRQGLPGRHQHPVDPLRLVAGAVDRAPRRPLRADQPSTRRGRAGVVVSSRS